MRHTFIHKAPGNFEEISHIPHPFDNDITLCGAHITDTFETDGREYQSTDETPVSCLQCRMAHELIRQHKTSLHIIDPDTLDPVHVKEMDIKNFKGHGDN